MLLRNNNKKFIRTLSNSCLKANKIRNAVAFIAILLTTVLFMTVATVFQGFQQSMKEQTLRQAGTRFMASIKYTTPEKTKEIMADPAWETVGAERALWGAANRELANMNAYLSWMDETYATNSFMEIEKGHMPEKEHEIACDTEVLRLLGVPEKLGSQVVISYQLEDGTKKEETFVLSGIWEGRKYEQTAALMVSEAFLEKRIDESTLTHDATVAGAYTIRGSFASDKQVEEQLHALLENAGFDPEAKRGEKDAVVSHVSPAYETDTAPGGEMVVAGIGGVLLILLAGYLIIYNIFRISVLKDIRLYGQLKTIGGSPKQLRYIVKRQGCLLSAVGIPAGLVLGCLLGNALLPVVMAITVVSESSFIVPHIAVWLLAAAFAFLTVRISCSRPGRLAGKVSPVEALRYQESDGVKAKMKKGKDSSHRIFEMASANLKRNKGKTALVVLSISLSIILFNSVLNVTDCLEKQTFIDKYTVSDFVVKDKDYGRIGAEDIEKVMKSKLVESLEDLEGTGSFGKTYCHILPSEETADPYRDITEKVLEVNGQRLDVDDYTNYSMAMGFNEAMLKTGDVIEGELDYEKLKDGKHIVIILSVSDGINEEARQYHAGDRLKVDISGTKKEYEVLAVAAMNNRVLMDSSKGSYDIIGFSEEQFLRTYAEETNPIACAFRAKEGKFDALNEEITKMAAEMEGSVQTRLTAEQDFEELSNTYKTTGGVLAGVFLVIGILNLTNVILTGAIARQNEFAMMRSIGMSRRQLRKLFVCEGVMYAAAAAIAGILLSVALSLTIVKMYVGTLWFASYHLSLTAAVAIAVFSMILAGVVAVIVDKIWNKGSIVEKLNRVE